MLKKINASQLHTGMYLHKLCGNWTQHPFWKSSFLIDDIKTIDTIIKSGIAEVIIDTSKGDDVKHTQQSLKASTESQLVNASNEPLVTDIVNITMQAEWHKAQKICLQAKSAVASMLNEVRMGNSLNFKEVQLVVDDISASVARHPTTLINIARLKTTDDYSYLHSVAVCAMMAALSRQLGLAEDVCQQAALAGLIHDVGKALMPVDVLNKPGKLTEDEYALIQAHPRKGYELLVEGGSVNPDILGCCFTSS